MVRGAAAAAAATSALLVPLKGIFARCRGQGAEHVATYAEMMLPIRDGLPKLRDFPAKFGGSGEVMPK